MNLLTPSELRSRSLEPALAGTHAPARHLGFPVWRVAAFGVLLILMVGGAFCFKGHGVKTWLLSRVSPAKASSMPLAIPTVSQSRPTDGEDNVLPETPITVNLNLPNGKLDKTTLLPANVSLVSEEDGTPVVTSISASPGGGTITLQPETPLSPNTAYALRLGGLKDFRGMPVAAYSASFTTADKGKNADPAVQFEKVVLPNTAGIPFTCVGVGPDHKLYASADDGRIFRFGINPDGTLSSRESIESLQAAAGGRRLVTGFCFDPASPAQEPVLWVAHGFYAFENAPDWTGKITRMSGPGLGIVEDVVINLPRSYRDHLTNQPSFGPDGALYFPQGSNSAYGAPDATWGNRPEHLLNATVLRLDVTRLTPGQPINVKTPDAGGSYDPHAPGAALTIYATGIRNAFDLVWHSNGRLYVPTNGSSPGGNTPAGAGAPGLTKLPVSEDDWLFMITPGKYYGHPNPVQGHFVLNGGNPLGKSKAPGRVPQYPPGTSPDPEWSRCLRVRQTRFFQRRGRVSRQRVRRRAGPQTAGLPLQRRQRYHRPLPGCCRERERCHDRHPRHVSFCQPSRSDRRPAYRGPLRLRIRRASHHPAPPDAGPLVFTCRQGDAKTIPQSANLPSRDPANAKPRVSTVMMVQIPYLGRDSTVLFLRTACEYLMSIGGARRRRGEERKVYIMTSLIESLESRTLLSAPPQVIALTTQGRVVTADFKAASAVDASGVKTITADLKAAQLAKADKAGIRALEKGDAAALKVLGKAISHTEKVILKDVDKLVSEGNKLVRKPGNAKLIAGVAGLKATLTADASGGLALLTSDSTAVQSSHDTNANALVNANPLQSQLGTGVTVSHASLLAALTTLGNDVNLALTTDVSAVLGLF